VYFGLNRAGYDEECGGENVDVLHGASLLLF
jgi:hypothetical protein